MIPAASFLLPSQWEKAIQVISFRNRSHCLDKLCDQISDAILDACLAQDPYSKVACETAVKGERVFLLGEITTKAKVDYAQIARRVIQRVGYDHDSKGKMYPPFIFRH